NRAVDQDNYPTVPQWRLMIQAAADECRAGLNLPSSGHDASFIQTLANLSVGAIDIEYYPGKNGVVIRSRQRLNTSTDWFIRPMDEGNDTSSRTQCDKVF